MKPRTELSQDGLRSTSKEPSSKPSNTFSPTNSSGMSNFFNPRGPIRPQILVNSSTNPPGGSDSQNNPSKSQKVVIPQAKDFIRGYNDNSQQQQQQQQQFMMMNQKNLGMMMMQGNGEDDEYGVDDDEYYDEDDGFEGGGGRAMAKQIDPVEEKKLIMSLQKAGQNNPEFLKVLDILQKDDELKPLIIEHQTLLFHLKDMRDVKAEYMLSILTAAETEMYDSTRQRDELQAELQRKDQLLAQALRRPKMDTKEISANMDPIEDTNQTLAFTSKDKDLLLQQTQTAMFESEKLRQDLQLVNQEKDTLNQELTKERERRKNQKREQECTFKNLHDENQQLKKLNETLKQKETESKKQLEKREQEFKEEVVALQKKLKNQEELRVSMLHNKSKIEVDLQRNQQFIENLEKEIALLEKENGNLHRKMNSTYNSVLFQSYVNQNYLMGFKSGQDQISINNNNNMLDENTPARRNLSSSFQNSGLIDKKDNNLIGQPAFGYGQSTQKLKLLMSENNRSQGGQSFIAHSIYYGLGGVGSASINNNPNQSNIYFQRNDSLVRSNSIEVILLDDEESKKQNMFILGEEEKQASNASGGILTNKQSWFKTKGLFTDLSPINSISSQQMDPSTSRQNAQRLKKLHEVEEEQTEILGTHPGGFGTNPSYPTGAKYFEEQVRKLQIEIEKLKEENKELTQKMTSNNTVGQYFPNHNQTNESPYKQTEGKNLMFATPQNSSSNFVQNYQRGVENTNYQEVNQQYHRQIMNTNNINPMYSNEQSPMMMATFSNQKERQFYSQYNPDINNQHSSHQSSVPKNSEQERQKIVEEYNEKLQYEFSSKIQDIGNRLINLIKRFQPLPNEIQHYFTQEFNITLLKEIISDIANKVDTLIELQQSRIKSGVGVMSQGGQLPYPYFPNTMGSNLPFFQQYGQTGSNQWGGQQNISSHQNSTTMDQTPLDLKNLFLEEKEKRLQILEELHKTKENIMKFQTENDKLKQELNTEKQHNQTMVLSNLDYQNHNYESLMKNIQTLQQRCDSQQDENVNLKLKVSELESELLDERQKQQIKYEFSIENLKNNMYGQYFDHKLRYEEQLMTLKEEKFKLTTEIQSLLERNQVLKEQLLTYRDRISELEKENLNHSKENYILQNELDYETLKASQLQSKKDNPTKTSFLTQQHNMDKVKYEEIISKLEVRLKDLQYQSNDWELKAKKAEDMSTLTKIRFEDEIYRLKGDNSRILEELKNMQEASKKSTTSFNFENNQLNKLVEANEKKIGAMKIKHILMKNRETQKAKGYFKMAINAILKRKPQSKFNDSNFSLNMLGETNYARLQQLEEQVFKAQIINQSLTMLIGKILRQINVRKSIKVNLSGLINKQVLDYVLYGLKNNNEVYDLNLSKSSLDDDDLMKICETLKFDQGIVSLKLSHNRFANISPLLDAILIKSKMLKQLDISYCQINLAVLERLPTIISQLENLEDLSISGLINSQLSQNRDKVNNFLNSIIKLPKLKVLDLSKNKLQDESINLLLTSLKNHSLLQSLALNSIGINDQSCSNLSSMIKSLKVLKRLSLSGNSNLSSVTIEQILQNLKLVGIIEDLDLSKCKVSTSTCMQALANLMISNRKLKQLSLQRIQLGDSNAYYIVQPLSECLNIETVRLDFNELGPTFAEKLVKKMIVNKISSNNNKFGGVGQSSSNSFYQDDSDSSFINGNEDEVNSSTQFFIKNHNSSHQATNQGLITLSMEGNNIGDRGAKAFADLIKIPNDNSKKLKMINLNECGISNLGYEELKVALMERGNLALNAHLSHVKITIERNNINY